MNKLLSIALGVSTMGTLAFSQQAATADNEAISFTGSVGYESNYVFRGIRVARDSMQTELSAKYQTFELGIWNHTALRSSESWSNEINIFGSAGMSLTDAIDGAVVATVYHYPSSPISDNRTTFEPGVTFSFDLGETIYVSPEVGILYDVDLKDWTFYVSGDYTVGLGDGFDLVIDGELGYVVVDGGSNFIYGGLSANVEYSVQEPLTLFAGVRGSFNDLSRADRGDGALSSTNFWGGVGVRASF